MFWKRDAIECLKDYNAKSISVHNLQDEIAELTAKKNGIRSATGDGTPVKGGGNGREDALINSMVRLERLQTNLREVKRWVARMERGLSSLTEEERKLLTRFYITPEKGAAERLATDLNIDIKTVYHRKDRALRKFTIAMYGCMEN